MPSWIGALPEVSDRDLVTAEGMQLFIEEGGVTRMIDDLKGFVAREILPARPVMLGIDHAATGGVVSALTEKLGPENLTVIVLDRHFDALSPSVRTCAFTSQAGTSLRPFAAANRDNACCGNFWAYLIERKTVDPTQLVFVGVADYPSDATPAEWALFKESYLAFEKQGCRFLPLPFLEKKAGLRRLRRFLTDVIATPYVYVSLDLDVGAYNAIHAARYMDGVGIDRKVLMEIAQIVATVCRDGRHMLAGLDIMEFNMHLLGIQLPSGESDRTRETVVEFAEILFQSSS
jgi:arginase family enzyme